MFLRIIIRFLFSLDIFNYSWVEGRCPIFHDMTLLSPINCYVAHKAHSVQTVCYLSFLHTPFLLLFFFFLNSITSCFLHGDQKKAPHSRAHCLSMDFTLLSANEQYAAWPPNEVLVAVDLNNNMLVTKWREEQRASSCYRRCLIVLSLSLSEDKLPNIIS